MMFSEVRTKQPYPVAGRVTRPERLGIDEAQARIHDEVVKI
jgi:hypothetical protein